MSHDITRRDFVKAGAAMAAGAAFGLVPTHTIFAGNPTGEKTAGILNYNEQMEYRRGGKTNVMFSAVCLGGHWKRVDKVITNMKDREAFAKNRYDVVTRCIERGINFIDASTLGEAMVYSKALQGRRDKMYLGFSNYSRELWPLDKEMQKAKKEGKPKPPGWVTQELKKAIDDGMKTAKLDYVDVWRVTCGAKSSDFSDGMMEEMCEALAWAKKTGRARFTGMSSHDRPHQKEWIQRAPKELEVVLTPYCATTKMTGGEIGEVQDTHRAVAVREKEGIAWEDSLWGMIQKCDVAWFGIKPFASNSLFKGDSSPTSPHREEDDKFARLTIRAILSNPAITAPIPGLITPEQVDNVCLAVLQRRELDAKERAELDAELKRAYANLPPHYHWLRDWGYV
jgi:aryl-alcohol dehydrogenase-like predicted oxidoreductase